MTAGSHTITERERRCGVYYELYIDLLFLLNFMMDSLILLSVKTVLKEKTDNKRIFGGGAVGSGLMCLLIVVPMPAYLKNILLYLAVPVVMLSVALRIRNVKMLLKAFGVFYITAFLWGGIQLSLRPYIRKGSIFFAVSVVSYYVLKGCWQMMTKIRDRQKTICEVSICTKNGEYRMKALIDTGNTLTDPVSKEPVCVIGKDTARQLFSTERDKKIRYIPFRTVDGEGVIPVLRAEKMCIYLSEEQWVTRPVIGIGRQVMQEEEYQMILNPDIIGGART